MIFEPLHGPAVWTRRDLARTNFSFSLDRLTLEEFDLILRKIKSEERDVGAVTAADFRSTRMLGLAHAFQTRLAGGPGFFVLDGWDSRGWSEEDLKILLWGFGTLLGKPRVQNLKGDRISVVAKAPTALDSKVAGSGDSTVSKGDDEIRPHTEKGRLPEPPRIIALLSVNKALTGGDTCLISGYAIYNCILTKHPKLLERLYRDFPSGRHNDHHADGLVADYAPVFRHVDGRLIVRYNRPWVHVAERSLGETLDVESLTALDAIEEAIESPDLQFSFQLVPGQLLVADNRVVLHARKRFLDGLADQEKRRLLRLWVD